MRLLLDTCTFYWGILDSPLLSTDAAKAITDPGNEAMVSPVSVWELLVKHALGRLSLPKDPGRFLAEQRAAHRLLTLSLEEQAVLQLPRLPVLHKDPFYRMLVCQAIADGCILVTPDPLVRQYPIRTMW